MRAILLAAGLGTRLRPITDKTPKCLVPINGKPLLGYWLDALVHLGIRSILINLHHYAEQVIDFARERCDTHQITWSYEKRLLGTGGTVRANQEFCGNEKVMVIHSDNYCRSTLKQFVAAHDLRPTGTDITMMTFVTPNPRSCGIVELDEYNVVNKLFEKVPAPPSNLANGAVYIFEPLVI